VAEPSYISGARLALPAVAARTDLLRRQAEDSSTRAGLLKDVGLADAAASLKWEQEQTAMMRERERMEAQRREMAAAIERQRRANAQARSRARRSGGGGGGSSKERSLANARKTLDKPKSIQTEIRYAPRQHGQQGLRPQTSKYVIRAVEGARSADEAVGRLNIRTPNSQLEQVVRSAFTRDGKVKDSFKEWAGKATQENFERWQRADASVAAKRVVMEQEKRAAEEANNRDGLGSIAHIGSKIGGGLVEGLDRLAKAFPTGVDAASRAGRTERSFLDLSTLNDFGRGQMMALVGGPRRQMSEVLDPRRGNLTPLGHATVGQGQETSRAIFGLASDLAVDPINAIPAGLLTKGLRAGSRVTGLSQAAQAFGQTTAGRTLRKGFVPFTATRDYVRSVLPGASREVADEMAESVHGALNHQMSWVNEANQAVDVRVADLAREVGDPAKVRIGDRALNDVIYDAMDIGGDVSLTVRELMDQGHRAAAGLLKGLDEMRGEAFDNLIRAGVDPAELRTVDDYIRHVYSPEGREALGLPPLDRAPTSYSRRGTSKTGTVKGRTFLPDDSAAEKAAALGIDEALIRDPALLVATSLKSSQDVLARANLVDEMAKVADDLGLPEDAVVWYRPAGTPGQVETAEEFAARSARKGLEKEHALASGRSAEEAQARASKVGARKLAGVMKPPPGYVKVAPGRYLPEDLAEDVTNLQKADILDMSLKGYDKALNALRGTTLLNPVAMFPYMARNIYTAALVNSLRGMDNPALYGRAARLHKAVAKAEQAAGGKGGREGLAKALRESGLNDADAKAAMALRTENIYQPGRGVYRDVYQPLDPMAKERAMLGTRLGTRLNKPAEEVPRGALFLKRLDEGMSPAKAAAEVRKYHFDYTAAGKTRFERNVMARAAFFYTFATRAPKAFIGAAIDNPRVVAAMQKMNVGLTDPDETNRYGDPLGLFLETPLQNVSQLPLELGEVTGDTANKLSNPLIQGIPGLLAAASGDPNSRGFAHAARKLLPPIDRIARDLSDATAGSGLPLAAEDPLGRDGEGRRNTFLAKLSGAKFGRSYEDPAPAPLPTPGTPEWDAHIAGLVEEHRLNGEWESDDAGDLIDIEARRLNIPGRGEMNREEKVAAIEAAGGQVNVPPIERPSLAAAARMLNIPTADIERMPDDELARTIEDMDGQPMPVIPLDSQLRAIAKLYGIKVPSYSETADLLELVQDTPEFAELYRLVNRPGYLEAYKTHSYFEKAREHEELMALLGR
jgi:hypothetical protein